VPPDCHTCPIPPRPTRATRLLLDDIFSSSWRYFDISTKFGYLENDTVEMGVTVIFSFSTHGGQYCEEPSTCARLARTAMVVILNVCVVLLATGATLMENVGMLAVEIHVIETMSSFVRCGQPWKLRVLGWRGLHSDDTSGLV
jgi:hypothetical protein